MKIEIGKTYIANNGEKVTITKKISGKYCFETNVGRTYTEDGIYFAAQLGEWDLVKEFVFDQKFIELNLITFSKHWNYIAQDADGQVCLFTDKPEMKGEWWSRAGEHTLIDDDIRFKFNKPWNETLHKIVHTTEKTYLEPVLTLPKLAKDTKMLVRNDEGKPWKRRYFSHWTDNGKCMCFDYGSTSWSSDKTIEWEFWKLPGDDK